MSYEIEIAPNQFSKNNVVLQTIVVNPVQNAPVQTLHVKQEVDPNIGQIVHQCVQCDVYSIDKGQEISEYFFLVFNSSKKTMIFSPISALATKKNIQRYSLMLMHIPN